MHHLRDSGPKAAAARDLTRPSEYIPRALVEHLRCDGIDPARRGSTSAA
jgi:hypothetical protein